MEKPDDLTQSHEIIAEQVRTLYKNQRFVIASSLLISLLLYIPLRTPSNNKWMLAWIGTIVIVSLIRISMLLSYRRTVPTTEILLRRRKHIIFNATMSGFIWGALALI